MDILEKVAYIKGLAEGLSLDATKPEGKVLNAIIDLLGDVCEYIADMDDEVATLGEYVEELDYDLGAVEEDVYECDDDCDCGCDCDCDDCDCDCDCDDCDCDCDCDDEDLLEVMCPHCNEVIVYSSELSLDELECPACGKAVSDAE